MCCNYLLKLTCYQFRLQLLFVLECEEKVVKILDKVKKANSEGMSLFVCARQSL